MKDWYAFTLLLSQKNSSLSSFALGGTEKEKNEPRTGKSKKLIYFSSVSSLFTFYFLLCSSHTTRASEPSPASESAASSSIQNSKLSNVSAYMPVRALATTKELAARQRLDALSKSSALALGFSSDKGASATQNSLSSTAPAISTTYPTKLVKQLQTIVAQSRGQNSPQNAADFATMKLSSHPQEDERSGVPLRTSQIHGLWLMVSGSEQATSNNQQGGGGNSLPHQRGDVTPSLPSAPKSGHESQTPSVPTPQPLQNGTQNHSIPTDISPTEVHIITPQSGVIRDRKTNLVVQYHAGAQLQVTVNKKPLNTKEVQTQVEPVGENVVTQVWYNIPLERGENTLTVQPSNGMPLSIKLVVKDTSNVYKIDIAPANLASAPANGRSTITLEGNITDDQGNPIREDTVVTLTASAGKFIGADYDKDQPGFQVLARGGKFTAVLQSGLQAQKVRVRAAVERRVVKDPSRRVLREDNQATPAPITLPPTSSTSDPQSPDYPKNVGIPPTSNNPLPTPASGNPDNPLTPDIEAYTQVEFVTYLRPPITTGVVNFRIGGRSTDFFGSRTNFLNPDRKGTSFDLNGAVFSTGKVGEWLFTGAYNSQRPLNQTCDYTTRLFRGPQECEQTYPVYGDSSTVDYLTPSRDSLYARFERTSHTPGAEPDYFMWGDYDTREFARASQLFTATTRNLHGFKGNYSFGNLQVTGLFSNDLQGFERDTIVPNGTSGYYFLSHRLVVPGSENVYLESEEINRPGTVVERKPLSIGTDYEIDYDRGTLLFRRPMLATELNPFGESLVRRIVATYQFDNAGGGDTRLYAGRVQYNVSQGLNQKNSWLAGSYLREDQGRQDFELYGADLLFPLGKDGQVTGEYARSRNRSIFLGNVTGNAYRIEAYTKVTPWLQAKTYYRNVEAGFANNATTSFSPGQTRFGAQAAANVTRTTQLTASYDHERNYGVAPAAPTTFFDLFDPRPEAPPGSRVSNIFDELRAGVVQKVGAADLSLEYVHRTRTDSSGAGLSGNASEIVSRASIPITSSLAFRAQNEYNFNRNDPLYPSRSTFGLTWALLPGVNVQLAHQFLDSRVFGRGSITSLDTIMDRKLGENTSLTWRYSLLNAYNSITGEGAVGLNHRIVLAPGLRMNVGYEHIFNNQFTRTGRGQEFAQPYAVGQSASVLGLSGGNAYSLGMEYTDNPRFQASGRLEYRTGSSTIGSNLVISASAAGKITPALTALARFDQANAANQVLRGLGNTATAKLGLAYRDPNSDKFNGLLSYAYRNNPSTIPDTLLLGSGTGSVDHVFSAEALYALSWRWEFYGKYATRYSTTFLSSNFTNTSRVYLGQVRATYRLGYRMDVAGEVRMIGQSAVNYDELGLALETGYYLTPDLRLYAGYSFGKVDDQDFTGYRSKGGPYVGVALKLNELFSGFGRQRVAPPQQRDEQEGKPLAEGSRGTGGQADSNAAARQRETSGLVGQGSNVVQKALSPLSFPAPTGELEFEVQNSQFEVQNLPPQAQIPHSRVEISQSGIQIHQYDVQGLGREDMMKFRSLTWLRG